MPFRRTWLPGPPGREDKICSGRFCSIGAGRADAAQRADRRSGQTRTQSVEIFGGEQFGDNLTDAPVSGRTPRLNDNAVAGARYNYNFTDRWGIQLSSGYSWSRAARVASGKNDLGLTTVDLDVVWNIMPQYPVVAYAIIGAGYAW